MVLSDLVFPGMKIDIQAVEKAILGKASDRKTFVSKVYDVLDDDTIEILMPMDGSKLILLPVDGEYQFCFYTKKGLYQCFVKVTDRYKDNNVYILLCTVTTEIQKHQRREYYRLNCFLPVKTRELMDEEKKAVENKEFRMTSGLQMAKGTILDISGGGIRFLSAKQYAVETQIAISFSLNVHGKENEYFLVGEILAVKKKDTGKDEFEHRVKFTYISKAQREDIIRYIFEEERRSRNRL